MLAIGKQFLGRDEQVDFLEMETVIQSFYPDLAFSELPPFQKLQFSMETFVLVLTVSLVSCLTSSVKNYYVK